LKSEVRMHPYLDLDNCPPLELTRDVIRYAMREVAGYGWSEVTHVGNQMGKTPEQIIQRMWRKALYYAEHHRNLYLQHVAHTHVLCYKDESFAHQYHNGRRGLRERESTGLVKTICAQVRDSVRICITGSTTAYGHLTGYYYWGGKWHVYRDCMWVNKNGNEVLQGGRYVELTGEIDSSTGLQKIRSIYRKPLKSKLLSSFLVPALRIIAVNEGALS